jgi:hypothetical protein
MIYAYFEYYIKPSIGPPENRWGWAPMLVRFKTLESYLKYFEGHNGQIRNVCAFSDREEDGLPMITQPKEKE